MGSGRGRCALGPWAMGCCSAVAVVAVLLTVVLLTAVPGHAGPVAAYPSAAPAVPNASATPAARSVAASAPPPQPTSLRPFDWAAYRRTEQRWSAADLVEPRPAGTQWQALRVGGVLRRYLLSLPTRQSGPAPLVVAFHGLRQRAGWFAAATGLAKATRAAGEILAVPESDGPAFNDGRLGARGPADDAFALAVIARLVGQHWADPRRVVVTGFSNGAGMAMEVAARHPRTVSAVVSVGGELIAAPGAPRPTNPVQAYLVHGTADPIQPWPGRAASDPTWPAYLSEPATVAQWVTANHAGPESSRQFHAVRGHDALTIDTWAATGGGASVSLFAVAGMAHIWPMAPTYPIDATALVVHVAATAVPAAGAGT